MHGLIFMKWTHQLGNKLTKEKILFYIFGKMRRNRLFIIGQTGEAKSDLCK